MRIEPQSEIVLARGLGDHADSGTYYVQAVVRNAKTDALIATINLTDRGNRRFTKEWRVPSDPTGQGLDILITFTVYTDSGYTTKSENYTEMFVEHRIEHIPNRGGGGADVDYRKVRQIVQEELDKLPPYPKPIAPKEPNLTPVLDGIEKVHAAIRILPAPEKQPDLKPIVQALQQIFNVVSTIEIPKTDLSGIEVQLDGIKQTLDASNLEQVKTELQTILENLNTTDLTQVKEQVDGLFTRIKEFLGNDIDQFNEQVASLKQQFENIDYVILQKGEKKINEDPE